MAKFDLNKTEDFARATNSDVASTLLRLTGLSGDNWDIEEAAYGHKELVKFHTFKGDTDYDGGLEQVVDSGGRRKAVFAFPYQDGQSTDDLGRRGETFEFQVLLFGKNYKKAYDQLKAEINDPSPGTLLHPVRGRIRATGLDIEITHRFDARKAMALRVKFIEHTFDITFEDRELRTTKSVLGLALSFLAAIDSILNKIDSFRALAQTVKLAIKSKMQSYREDYQTNLSNLNRTFNTTGSEDLPGLLPTNQPASDGTVAVVISPNDPLANVTTTTGTALSVQQAEDNIAALRRLLNELIALLLGVNNGKGGLLFYDDILTLKRSAVAMQDVLEVGIASSKTRLITYTVPTLMSIREVCFANGLSPDLANEVLQLNPDLLSVNYIEKGTQLKVAVTT